MSNQSTLRVAVCGGGIAGLTLACGLSKHANIQIDIYEAASQFSGIGAGVGAWWRAQRVLQAVGLEEDLAKIGCFFNPTKVPSLRFYKADQAVMESFGTVEAQGGFLALHRPDFQSVLLHHIKNKSNCTAQTSKRLISFTDQANGSTDPIMLQFQDGTTAECDVLVGADGIKSVTRALMLEYMARGAREGAEAAKLRDLIAPQYSGVDTYRTVISTASLRKRSPNNPAFSGPCVFVGKDRTIIAYVLPNGDLMNVTVVEARHAEEGAHLPEPWVSESEAGAHEIAAPFKDWDDDARHIVACVAEKSVKRWSIHVVKPLPSFVHGRVVLMGDAAHAMQPFLGSGAGQAIEDAYALSVLLTHPLTHKSNIAHALEIYSRVRVPISALIADLSRTAGRRSTLFGEREMDTDGLRDLGERMVVAFEVSTVADPMEDIQKAVEILTKELSPKSNETTD